MMQTQQPPAGGDGASLVPINHQQAAIAPLGMGDGPDFWCSVPTHDAVGKAITYQARQGNHKRLTEGVNLRLNVENLLYHPVEYVSQTTGELEEGVRIVLITDKGEMHECCSHGVRSCIRSLVQVFGLPPWKGGLPLVVKMTKTRRGNNLLTLELDTGAAGGAKGKG